MGLGVADVTASRQLVPPTSPIRARGSSSPSMVSPPELVCAGAPPRYSGRGQSAKRERAMDLKLTGKRVLVTGASKGIGAATAAAFAEEGCHVRLVARSADALGELAGRLSRQHNIEATAHVADLRQSADIARLAAEAEDVDILVNNAGDIPG